MASLLPIFPLSLVVFPGEHLNLHVFEPRYKQLINECLAYNSTFGIPAFINGKLCPLGTEVEVLSVERVYSKGEMDIKTLGLKIFEIDDLVRKMPDKLYSAANVKWVENRDNGDVYLRDEVLGMLQQLHKTLNISKDKLDDPETFDTYKVAHYVGFSLEEEYDFLCLRSERERQFMLMHHLQKILPIVQETERLKERVQANGHFKDVLPPQF